MTEIEELRQKVLDQDRKIGFLNAELKRAKRSVYEANEACSVWISEARRLEELLKEQAI